MIIFRKLYFAVGLALHGEAILWAFGRELVPLSLTFEEALVDLITPEDVDDARV